MKKNLKTSPVPPRSQSRSKARRGCSSDAHPWTNRCRVCGRSIPYPMTYCSSECARKDGMAVFGDDQAARAPVVHKDKPGCPCDSCPNRWCRDYQRAEAKALHCKKYREWKEVMESG